MSVRVLFLKIGIVMSARKLTKLCERECTPSETPRVSSKGKPIRKYISYYRYESRSAFYTFREPSRTFEGIAKLNT